MGTRSVTYIHNGNRDADVMCAIYRQMDGYPTGMGADIADAIGGKTLVNSISGDKNMIMNGMGCAAAQLIASLKNEPGSIYMISNDAGGEDFNYHIFFDGDIYEPGPDAKLSVEVDSFGEVIWSGVLSDFDGEKIEDEQD